MRRADGWRQPFFEIDSYRVHVEERVGDDEPPLAEATVKVVTKGTRHIESAEGQGPVGALDNALRKALANDYPELEHISLEDFRVRVLDETGARGLKERARSASGSPQRQGTGAWSASSSTRRTASGSGPRSASRRTSSRPRGRRCVDGYLYGLLHPRDDDEVPSPPAVP